MWWKSENDDKVSYISYRVNQTEVLVGPKLDKRGCTYDFFKSVSGWLVVTESYVEYPIEANVRWFPWKEIIEEFPDHAIYGSLKMLNYWINELKLPRVYIHCDNGTHRAPSVFGAFLSGYYSDIQSEIIKNRKVVRRKGHPAIGRDGKVHAEPDRYFKTKTSKLPLLSTMVRMIVERPSESLDQILKSTFDNRPLGTYTPEEKALYDQEQIAEAKQIRISDWLIELGFNFEVDNKLSSFKDVDTPNGKSHIVGDRFFPDMYFSLEKYGRVYLTSEEGKAQLEDRLPQVQVKETKTKDDLVLHYYEFDLNSIKTDG